MKRMLELALIGFILAGTFNFSCKDSPTLGSFEADDESMLAAVSDEETVEHIKMLKTLKGEELAAYVNTMHPEVVWDGKSEFKPRVNYIIPAELVEKAKEMNEGYRTGLALIEKARLEKELKKKSQPDEAGLAGACGAAASASCPPGTAMGWVYHEGGHYAFITAIASSPAYHRYDHDAGVGPLAAGCAVGPAGAGEYGGAGWFTEGDWCADTDHCNVN